MKVLVVEDEILIAEIIIEMMEEMGITVCGHAVSGVSAIELARKHEPNLVLMDFRLKGEMNGAETAIEINKILTVPVIFVTGSAEHDTFNVIQSANPAGILYKPFRFAQLKAVIEKVVGSFIA